MARSDRCRICGSIAHSVVCSHGACLVRCARCGFASLMPPPSDEEFARAYLRSTVYNPRSFSERSDAIAARWHNVYKVLARQVLRQCESLSQPWRILDVGCGEGALLRALVAEGGPDALSLFAVEPRGTALGHACKTSGCQALGATIDDAATAGIRFSAIVMHHVLEHCREPWEVLIIAHDLLTERGRIVLSVPNCGGLRWHLRGLRRAVADDDPTHLHFFTSRSLRVLLRRTGFGQVRALWRGGLEAGRSAAWAIPQSVARALALSSEVRVSARKGPRCLPSNARPLRD